MSQKAEIGPDDLKSARILALDDQNSNLCLLEQLLLFDGYRNIKLLTDSRELLDACAEFQPDLLLLDYHMSHLSGLDILNLMPEHGLGHIPAVVLTADVSDETRRAALKAGAKDFLTKPIDPIEALVRVRNLLETKVFQARLEDEKDSLERRVRERTQDLEMAQAEIVDRLAYAAEFRDDDTRKHTQRVGAMAASLAKALGRPEEEVELLRRAVPLHDIGKIGIPDAILLKPGRLSPEELEVMRTHVTIGAEILGGARFCLLQMAQEVALTHHERWDGTGYPHGLSGTEIPLSGRITAVIDVFDALTSDRPYKKAWPVEDALAELERQAGRQFDPAVVEAFLVIARDPVQRQEWQNVSHWVRTPVPR